MKNFTIAYIEDNAGDLHLFKMNVLGAMISTCDLHEYSTCDGYLKSKIAHDVVVSDLFVPDFNDGIFESVVKKENKPFFLYSSSNPQFLGDSVKNAFINMGVGGYFQKGVHDADLAKTIKDYNNQKGD